MAGDMGNYETNSSDDGSSAPASAKKCSTIQRTNEQDLLLTPKALELSLSPPRAPPFGTAQRALLTGKNPSIQSWAQHYHVREAHSLEPHATLRQRLIQQWTKTKSSKHPHMAEKSADAATRLLGVWWSVERQNRFRDTGSFRLAADGIVTATAPMLALSAPSAVPTFHRLTRHHCQSIPYGPHPRQRMDLYLPLDGRTVRRLIFFVHGGAWGSGMPWMYRLVAAPYLQQGWAVTVPGYRTYPDGCVAEQVEDLELAASALQQQQQYLDIRNKNIKCTLMGHSSGAHISLLLLVDRAKERKLRNNESADSSLTPSRLQFDSFVGLSGPYGISHHFDYEAGRGVEELSPMKPVNGYTRESFRQNSPALRLQGALAAVRTEGAMNESLPAMVLIHGIEDDTVPFTATAEAARILRSCGLTRIQEIYVPGTGHQDMVMQIMLGGRTRDTTIEWINGLSAHSSAENAGTRLLTRSKL
jgi:acetyl esterase/lipase